MHEMLSRNADLDPEPRRRRRPRLRLADRRPGRATSPRPPRSRPGCPTRSPACSSTGSAPRAWRRSTSPPRRSPRAGRTWCSPAASSRCRRVPMGSDGGAWAMDPETNYDTSFVPQGIGADLIATIEEFSREDVDAYAARSQERAATAQAEGRFNELGRAGARHQRARRPRPRRVHPPRHHGRDAGRAEAVVRRDRRDGRLRRRRAAEVPLGREDQPRPHAGQLLGHRRRRVAGGRSATSRPATSSGCAPRARILATAVSGADPTIMLTGPAPGQPQGAGQGRADRRRPRPGRDQRGVRRGRAAVRQGHGPRHGEGQRQRRRDRDGPPARRHRRR